MTAEHNNPDLTCDREKNGKMIKPISCFQVSKNAYGLVGPKINMELYGSMGLGPSVCFFRTSTFAVSTAAFALCGKNNMAAALKGTQIISWELCRQMLLRGPRLSVCFACFLFVCCSCFFLGGKHWHCVYLSQSHLQALCLCSLDLYWSLSVCQCCCSLRYSCSPCCSCCWRRWKKCWKW